MDKKNTENAITVMLAHTEGKTIQVRDIKSNGEWMSIGNPSWNWRDKVYRVKPDDETLDEYLQRSEMFGPYIKDVQLGTYVIPTRITKAGVVINASLITFNMLRNSENYTWSGGENIFNE